MNIMVITEALDGISAEMALQLASRQDAHVGLVMTTPGQLCRWLKLLASARVEALALAVRKDEVKAS